ncbi:UNVERIFIED_CONTAM: hypothetical protein GTU68_037465, partial [Idotea baltica]|nr:hypothetical protein [Idotea baltica]
DYFKDLNDNIINYEKLGINSISFLSENYPPQLLNIEDYPPILFYKGNIKTLKVSSKLSIIGARKADLEGNNLAFSFAKTFAKLNVAIVSGLAYGIDSAAHKGALASNKVNSTIAILGNGLKSIYPKLHTRLSEEIIQQGGLILSQFEPDAKPLKHHFLNRNRLIASLSEVTLVIQANAKSGSLVTARYANEFGKSVCAIPGSINSPLFSGCNKLIKNGAYLIEDENDLSEVLNVKLDVESNEKLDSTETNNDDKLLSLLKNKISLSFLEINKAMSNEKDLLTRLLKLELEGKVIRLPGGDYGLNHLSLCNRFTLCRFTLSKPLTLGATLQSSSFV